MKSLKILEEFIKEALLSESDKYPGNPEYYEGLTDEEKKIMAREIKKCSKNPKPKACYSYPWPAEKRIEKNKKKKR